MRTAAHGSPTCLPAWCPLPAPLSSSFWAEAEPPWNGVAFSFQARGFQRASSPEAPSQEAVHSPCTQWPVVGAGLDLRLRGPLSSPSLGVGHTCPHSGCASWGPPSAGWSRQAGRFPGADGRGGWWGGTEARPLWAGGARHHRAWARKGPSGGRTLDTLAGGLCSQVPSYVQWGRLHQLTVP